MLRGKVEEHDVVDRVREIKINWIWMVQVDSFSSWVKILSPEVEDLDHTRAVLERERKQRVFLNPSGL